VNKSGGGDGTATGADQTAAEQTADGGGSTAESAPAPDAGTVSQQSAQDKAEQYLNIMGGFSHDGLIRQLTTGDGFSTEDATWAVDRLDVDWNEQAAEKAKQYQDTIGGFSRSSMIQQLTTGDAFTQAEAEHGASAVGL
jgi:hypothetical protein